MTNKGPIEITPRLAARFWAKVDRREPDQCWLWTASLTVVGYGQIGGDGGRKKRAMFLAHRVVYVMHYGPIPDGLQLDHLCSVRHCVNPAHLEAVTQQENLRRGNARLTREQVRAIRSEVGTDRALGEKYDVHHSTIWRIRAGVGWVGEGEPVQAELPVARAA